MIKAVIVVKAVLYFDDNGRTYEEAYAVAERYAEMAMMYKSIGAHEAQVISVDLEEEDAEE